MAVGGASFILQALLESDRSSFELRRYAMGLLAELPGYDWCGVYRLEGAELVLDAYVGAPTEHERIPVGTGVCGVAVAEGRNQVVADVSTVENYLACSTQTRAEIVVLIRTNAEILGQVDIDSHVPGAFGEDDERFLEAVAAILAERWL